FADRWHRQHERLLSAPLDADLVVLLNEDEALAGLDPELFLRVDFPLEEAERTRHGDRPDEGGERGNGDLAPKAGAAARAGDDQIDESGYDDPDADVGQLIPHSVERIGGEQAA